MMDRPIAQAVSHLSEDRMKLLLLEDAVNNVKLAKLVRDIKIHNLINAAGRASIIFFNLRLLGKIRVRDLTRPELMSITRYFNNRDHLRVVNEAIGLNLDRPEPADRFLYWHNGLKELSNLTARQFRESQSIALPLCTYKIGAILTPSENSSWTYKLRKLTSTRHKNLLLKIAHGDWYSRERLHRFGLINDPQCEGCGQIETIKHKVLECPIKLPYWEYLARLEGYNLNSFTEPLEFALGMHTHESTTSLTIHVELMTLLLYRNPELPPTRTIELIRAKLKKIDHKNKGKF